MEIKGICALCQEEKVLTFEHVPPRAAFNNKPLFVKKAEHLFPLPVEEGKINYSYGKRHLSNRGFGYERLCKECNNNTGARYANDYVEFAKQGMIILQSIKDKKEVDTVSETVVKFKLKIKPLNIFKQILLMFVTIDASNIVGNTAKMKSFLENKESNDFPTEINVFMYCTSSDVKRRIGYSFGLHYLVENISNWYC